MEIKSITTIKTLIGSHFEKENALVTTSDGKQYVYLFEFSDTWKDIDDYLDNVRSDFENEWEDDPNFGTEEFGLLFIRRDIAES
jgi:hypothetical protein